MRKKSILKAIALLPVLGIITSFYLITGSTISDKVILMRADQCNKNYRQEKIYLQLDRSSYWANDDIWFKAYLKESPIPDCNLYVELLNSSGNVVLKKMYWAQNGLAYGDFHLKDTISSGIYQIRAYTNWMRNFDDQWFFRKDLVIWNMGDKAVSPESDELKARQVDFQFMPEGGTFLAGAKNRMAFKVNDRNGKGLDTEGIVVDGNGNEIARIKSGFKGMGSFWITPQADTKYTAELTVAGNLSLNIDLPKASVSGLAMKINPEDTSKVHLEINEIGGISGEKYFVVGQSAGKICFHSEVSMISGKCVLDISRDEFPTGIVRLTLFDQQMTPRCERLVFVNHHDQVVVKIEPEKAEYHTREKVILDLYTMGKNEAPVMANLSMSVYYTESSHATETYPENILTSFLLSSELKGRVEEPAFYFKENSLSTVLALDNLMLTHGYRYFDWKEISETRQPKIDWQPEPCVQIKGTVISVLFSHPVPNGKISMMTVKSLLDIREVKTDSAGRFVISDLFFNDTIQVALQSRNENGKANAEIELDERSSTSPEANFLPLMYEYRKDNPSQTVTYLSELSPELRNKKWHLSDTILLRDVNIMVRKKKTDDGHFRPYVDADYVIDVAKLDDVNGSILETLEMNSPMYRSWCNQEREGVKFFLDGVPDITGIVASSPASWYDKIEFVRMAPIPGAGFGRGIYFYTKRGAPNEKPTWASGITATKLVGYSVIRNFYSPVYDGSEDKKNNKNDFRSTLYWNPLVETDEDGTGWVSYYNSDLDGEVQVVVEGVTKDGKLCRGEFKYNVVSK
jgi:hypothetical protein